MILVLLPFRVRSGYRVNCAALSYGKAERPRNSPKSSSFASISCVHLKTGHDENITGSPYTAFIQPVPCASAATAQTQFAHFWGQRIRLER